MGEGDSTRTNQQYSSYGSVQVPSTYSRIPTQDGQSTRESTPLLHPNEDRNEDHQMIHELVISEFPREKDNYPTIHVAEVRVFPQGKQRFALFALACIHTFLTSGVVFGWSALRSMLTDSGVYANLCPDGEVHCDSRNVKFSLVFTIGSIANYLSNLPFGLILDKFGPRFCSVTGGALFLSGTLIFAFADSMPFDGYMVGFCLFGIAGPAVQIPLFHLSNLFQYPGTVISILTALFDASSAVFPILQVLSSSFSLSLRSVFVIYSIMIGAVLLTGFMWPKRSYEKAEEEQEVDPIMVDKRLYNVDLKTQILSIQFAFVALFAAVHVLRLNFVVASVTDQVEYVYGHKTDTSTKLVDLFSTILPFGFVGLPASGWLLDKKGASATSLTVNIIGLGYGIALLFPTYATFVMSFVLVSLSRQLVYSTFFTFTSQTFGFRNWGKLSGLNNVVVSLVSLLQYPLIDITYDDFGGNFRVTNIVLVSMVLPLFAFLCMGGKKKKAIKEQEETRRWEHPAQVLRVQNAESDRPVDTQFSSKTFDNAGSINGDQIPLVRANGEEVV